MDNVAVKIGCSVDDIVKRKQVCDCLESFALATFAQECRNNGAVHFSPVWPYTQGISSDDYVAGRYAGLIVHNVLLTSSAVVWLPALDEDNLFAKLYELGYRGRRIVIVDQNITTGLDLDHAKQLRASSHKILPYDGSVKHDVSGGNYSLFVGKISMLMPELLRELHEL